MAVLIELERYCDRLLESSSFEDYCPNGLQVDAGGGDIQRVISGVTASQALIEAAAERGADLLLVHHGFFWRGEPSPLIGVKGRRIRTLMQRGMSLLAYHLPLDAHPELGNNFQLARRLEFPGAQPLEQGDGLIWWVENETVQSAAALAARIASALGREPLHIAAGEDRIQRIGWCTGAAQGQIERAAAAGLDAFISGEISESTVHLARELGVHYFSAGHHATERYGVQALGRHLAGAFGLEHEFLDIPNPV
jgi:dinuclear metal center YbgI/SA1388 family protein